MRTRSQSRNLNRQQQQAPPAFVEPFNLEEPIENPAPPVVTMDDTRTMAQLLEAPIKGYEDAIVVPEITANNFELKHGLLTLVQNKQFFGHDKEDPHAHIRYFNKSTSTMKFPNVPSTSTTNLRNEITRFQQRFDETFYEAWDRFNDLLRACPHHGFLELHQLDTFYNALNSNDQDSLNSASGGNFLDKMPRDCLRIIKSKSKVRNSRNKPVVTKVSSNSSTPGISPDVAELKDMVKALLLNKKSQAPTPVKAVEESCVTYGGAHSYQNFPATNDNVYHDNIQEYVSQAAAANYNLGNTGYRALISNQIRPPGFPLVQNNQNNQGTNQNRYNQGNNFNKNKGNNYNQNQGNNYNQGQIYQPPVNQPPVHQAPPYQALAPQTQGVTKTDFESYVKANDAVMRNMQDQNQNLQNQMTNLTDMLSKFMNANTASSSGTGSLSSNTVTNPKEDLKGITTQSGVAYQGPTIPTTSSSPKVVERETEVTKDTMLPTNNGSTKDVQPPVVQVTRCCSPIVSECLTWKLSNSVFPFET
ncbi:reverse transcriptase domain-containing protein [Tanacetum coccineum]